MTNEQLAILLTGIANKIEAAISQVDDELGDLAQRHQVIANPLQTFCSTEKARYVDGDVVVLDTLREVVGDIRRDVEILTSIVVQDED